MVPFPLSTPQRRLAPQRWLHRMRKPVTVCFFFAILPALALAQSGSPFDTGFTAIQTLFTGTVAKVTILIAILVGGYQFAHGEPGSKQTLRTAGDLSRCRSVSGLLVSLRRSPCK
jgi:type IV secretory pathway VirB2 component (pilin)